MAQNTVNDLSNYIHTWNAKTVRNLSTYLSFVVKKSSFVIQTVMASYVRRLIVGIFYPCFKQFCEHQKNVLKWFTGKFLKPRASEIKSNVTELEEDDEQKIGEDSFLVPEDIYGAML